jgi:hypothetical protein
MIEVLEAFALATLTRRSATLDGSVPVRAAQACVPLLEGNAYGLQLRLSRPITIERRLGRKPRVIGELAHAAALPRLVAHGYVGEAWRRAFADGPLFEHRGVLYLFTGLLARASAATVLRVSANANRRNLLFDVDPVLISDDALTPIVLPIRTKASTLRLDGELATLGAFQPDRAIERVHLRDAPDAGRAHVEFYDAQYFANKKGESTKKYRKLVSKLDDEPDQGPTRVVEAGPVALSIERLDRFLSPTSPTPVRRDVGVSSVGFDALLSFEATFDGHALHVTRDEALLARDVRKLERLWNEVYGEGFVQKHRGALFYLTKYFTPHPHGEPHFFVKPWAFVQTPEGVSSLIEGALGDGWEVMRGVVATDVFHAAPAVFRVHRVGVPVRVREGARLINLLPIPRAMLEPRTRALRFADDR